MITIIKGKVTTQTPFRAVRGSFGAPFRGTC